LPRALSKLGHLGALLFTQPHRPTRVFPHEHHCRGGAHRYLVAVKECIGYFYGRTVDLIDTDFDANRQTTVWQLTSVLHGVLGNQCHDAAPHASQQVDVRCWGRGIQCPGTRWDAERNHTGLFHQPHNLDVVDVAVGVHVAPAQRNLKRDHDYSCVWCEMSWVNSGYSARSSATVSCSSAVTDCGHANGACSRGGSTPEFSNWNEIAAPSGP